MAEGWRILIDHATESGDEGELRILHLSLATFSPELADRFDDVAQAHGVTFGEQPSGGVAGELSP